MPGTSHKTAAGELEHRGTAITRQAVHEALIAFSFLMAALNIFDIPGLVRFALRTTVIAK